VQTLEQLLQGFDEEDPEMAARALNSSFIKHMDVEYARLARTLPLPKGMAPLSSKAAPSNISPNQDSAEVNIWPRLLSQLINSVLRVKRVHLEVWTMTMEAALVSVNNFILLRVILPN